MPLVLCVLGYWVDVISLEIVMTRRAEMNNHGPLTLGIYYSLERPVSYIIKQLETQYHGFRVVRELKLVTFGIDATSLEVSERYNFWPILSSKFSLDGKALSALNALVFQALSPRKVGYNILYTLLFWKPQKNLPRSDKCVNK